MTKSRWPILLLTVAMLAACYLPWFYQSAAALRPGVLDVAEWITLTPAARASTPPLLASLSLRLTLGLATVALAWELALANGSGRRILLGLGVLLALATQLPPVEVITQGAADPNYRQQALVFVITLTGIGLSAAIGKALRRLRLGLLAILLGCGIWGVLEGISFFRGVSLVPALGAGAILFHSAAVLLFVHTALRLVPARDTQ